MSGPVPARPGVLPATGCKAACIWLAGSLANFNVTQIQLPILFISARRTIVNTS